ncbi:hypothetical protein TNCV_3339021 [Trichonephila clavipes]|nr:hypothetical protein TNCV_3339021 [Trichonephila clavipes]
MRWEWGMAGAWRSGGVPTKPKEFHHIRSRGNRIKVSRKQETKTMDNSRHPISTLDTADLQILNLLTISEIQYLMRLAPAAIHRSKSSNSCREAMIISETNLQESVENK